MTRVGSEVPKRVNVPVLGWYLLKYSQYLYFLPLPWRAGSWLRDTFLHALLALVCLVAVKAEGSPPTPPTNPPQKPVWTAIFSAAGQG